MAMFDLCSTSYLFSSSFLIEFRRWSGFLLGRLASSKNYNRGAAKSKSGSMALGSRWSIAACCRYNCFQITISRRRNFVNSSMIYFACDCAVITTFGPLSLRPRITKVLLLSYTGPRIRVSSGGACGYQLCSSRSWWMCVSVMSRRSLRGLMMIQLFYQVGLGSRRRSSGFLAIYKNQVSLKITKLIRFLLWLSGRCLKPQSRRHLSKNRNDRDFPFLQINLIKSQLHILEVRRHTDLYAMSYLLWQ